MGIFSKVSEWLTEKSDRFSRGDATMAGSYYASDAYEEAYGALRDDGSAQEPGVATGSFAAVNAQKDYGGRVPYQSQRELQQRQQEQAFAQQQTGEYAAVQNTGRMQPVAAQPAQQTMPPQAAQQQTAAPQQGAYAQTPYQAQSFTPQQANYQQQGPYGQANNVVPFPGMQRGPDGSLYAHVEYIVLLRSRNECKNVIEYIKQNASVFLNMEFIANDSERQRCVDMLSGAAYTLGCALNKISPRGIYLISSPSVYVVIDPAMQKMAVGQETRSYARAQDSAYQGYTQRQSYSAGAQSTPYTPVHTSGASASQMAGAQSAAFAPVQPTGSYEAVPGGPTGRRPVAQPGAYAGTGGYQAVSGTGSFRPVTAAARGYGEYQQ